MLLALHTEALQKAAIQEQTAQWKTWERKALLTANLVSAFPASLHLEYPLCRCKHKHLPVVQWLRHHASNVVTSSVASLRLACQCVGSEDEEQYADKAGDLLAVNLGITHFSVMLRRADKQEQEDVLGQAKRPK